MRATTRQGLAISDGYIGISREKCPIQSILCIQLLFRFIFPINHQLKLGAQTSQDKNNAFRKECWVLNMSASIAKFLPKTTLQTGERAIGSLIFFHGSGDSGEGIKSWLQSVLGLEFSFPHLRVVFPTAPPRPYTPLAGRVSNVWYDRKQISPFAPEDETVDIMCKELAPLIQAEVDSGIQMSRIVIGGFSMGGGIALHLGYRFHKNVAGVFALSSFLSNDSKVYQAIQSDSSQLPPLFQCHGKRDELVLYDWGHTTFNKLKELGVQGEFHMYNKLYHDLQKQELIKLQEWIMKVIPMESSM